jgi:hypothetical protein
MLTRTCQYWAVVRMVDDDLMSISAVPSHARESGAMAQSGSMRPRAVTPGNSPLILDSEKSVWHGNRCLRR